MAVCQKVTLGAVTSRSALLCLLERYLKGSVFFEQALYLGSTHVTCSENARGQYNRIHRKKTQNCTQIQGDSKLLLPLYYQRLLKTLQLKQM
jgi:hypothetical protein